MNPRHLEGILRAVHACLIHNTLLARPEIRIEHHATPVVSEAL